VTAHKRIVTVKNLSFIIVGVIVLTTLAAFIGPTAPATTANDRYTVGQAAVISIDAAEAYEAYKLFDHALYRTRCAGFALTSGFGGPDDWYFAPSADTPLLFVAAALLALSIFSQRRTPGRKSTSLNPTQLAARGE
jgi:hypothetical protein